jgi:hypothetical protein
MLQILVLALLATVLLTGMGNIGGPAEGTVPKTDENIAVRLVDRGGVATDLSRFSMDGSVTFKGRRGEGEVSIFLRDLKEVVFVPAGDSDVTADLLLKSGKRVQLKVKRSVPFYGDTGAGAYHITAGDVKRIDVLK